MLQLNKSTNKKGENGQKMKKKILKDTNTFTLLAAAPFVGASLLSFGLSVYFVVRTNQIRNDFENSAMFQEVKEEEVSQMRELEATYIEAQKKFDSGKISVKELNTAKKQFNAQKDYVESNTLVFDYMPQDVKKDYDSKNTSATITAVLCPILAGCGVSCAFAIRHHCEEIEKTSNALISELQNTIDDANKFLKSYNSDGKQKEKELTE